MRTQRILSVLLAGVAAVALAKPVAASSITPTYTTFGTLAAANWAATIPGTIPNNAVAITTVGTITLGLSVHGRFVGYPVSNDGAGTFTVQTGIDLLNPTCGSLAQPKDCSQWNFNFYTSQSGTGSYLYELLYDFDPGSGTDDSFLGRIYSVSTGAFTNQNSWNLGFGFLGTSVPGGLVAPQFGPFNPNSAGQYSFAIRAYDFSTGSKGALVAETAINVNAVPEPATLTLLGLGLVIGAARLRRRK